MPRSCSCNRGEGSHVGVHHVLERGDDGDLAGDTEEAITSQAVNDDVDLEKLKSPQTTTIPRFEKAIMELEGTLQKYSRTCNADEVEEMSDIMYNAIKEATLFVRTVTSMYNKGYASGLS